MLEHHAKGNVLLENCIYCNHKLENEHWKSEHVHHFHYKTCICKECGKEQHATVEFIGSGHDNWRRKKWLSREELEAVTKDFENLMQKFQLNPNRK